MIDRRDFEVKIYSDKESKLDLRELLSYRDLIKLLVRRDFLASYKQTIMGPAWAILLPVISTIIFAMVFGNLAGLSPDGIPVFLFYLVGQIFWVYLSSCLEMTANSYWENAYLISRVYFPRLAMPIAGVLYRSVNMLIQVGLFVIIYIIYVAADMEVSLDITAVLLPIYIFHGMLLASGIGGILSAVTTKYRDIALIIPYANMAWMYISPVLFDATLVPSKWHVIYMLNPVAPIMEHMRYAIFGQGMLCWGYYFISFFLSVLIFLNGCRIYNKVGRTFQDTV